MKKISLIIIGFLYIIIAKAQTLSNINGTSAQTTEFSDVKGSPFLFDDWAKGNVTMSDNSKHQDMDLKYSLLDDRLYFKNSSQSNMAFADPIKEFTISPPSGSGALLFRDGYQNIPGVNPTSFIEVLTDGKIRLLKKLSKKIQTENVYPNTSTNKFFTETKTYYIYKDDKGTLIKLDKKSIFSVLSDKQTELDAYIKQNKLNLKDDGDLAKLVAYYNSISN